MHECSLQVARGSITGLIGPNGAGKSTLFNLVAGNITPDSGRIVFDGKDITGLPPYQLFGLGMLRTFQIAHEFSNMTALENLMVVPGEQPGESLFSTWFMPGTVRSRDLAVKQKANDVIDFLKLAHVKNELAGNLSGGQKKLLELGRTMMVDAKIVLLDEVAAGVNRTLLQDLAANIERMNQELGLYLLRHRARHGSDRPALRSGDRDGGRRKDRRGPDGRNPRQSGDHRSLFRLARGGRLDARVLVQKPVSTFWGHAIMPLIEVKDVVGGYGGAPILNGVNIAIEQSDIGVIVGPNGAGKSTTLKAIFGLLKVSAGAVLFEGDDITNALPDRLVPRGLSFVPQEKNVFTTMSVEENLEMGAFTRRDDFSGTLEEIYSMFPVLKEKRRQPAGELSGGQRQMVAMGRALMSKPRLLMLDEPSAGLSPRYVLEIFEHIVTVNKAGVGILMVEQNARQALAFASRGFVLAQGQNRYTGTGAELIADPEVARSFLGG